MRFKSGVAAGALAASAIVAVPFATGTAFAAGHNSSSSCSVSPSTASVGATYVVSAVGLPIGTAVNLVVTAPSGSSVGRPLGSTPDGTFNLQESSPTAGTWTYEFTGPVKHNTTVYGVCSVQIT